VLTLPWTSPTRVRPLSLSARRSTSRRVTVHLRERVCHLCPFVPIRTLEVTADSIPPCAGTHYEAMDWSPSGPASGSSSNKTAHQPSLPTGAPFLFYTSGPALPSAQPPMPAHPPDHFRWDPNAFGASSSATLPFFGANKPRESPAVADDSSPAATAAPHHTPDEEPSESALIQRREIATGAVNRERRRRQQQKGRRRRRSFAADNDPEDEDDEDEHAKLEVRRQVHQHFALHNYNYGGPATTDQAPVAASVWWKGDTPYIIAGRVATFSPFPRRGELTLVPPQVCPSFLQCIAPRLGALPPIQLYPRHPQRCQRQTWRDDEPYVDLFSCSTLPVKRLAWNHRDSARDSRVLQRVHLKSLLARNPRTGNGAGVSRMGQSPPLFSLHCRSRLP
jgi:hypothetical protein